MEDLRFARLAATKRIFAENHKISLDLVLHPETKLAGKELQRIEESIAVYTDFYLEHLDLAYSGKDIGDYLPKKNGVAILPVIAWRKPDPGQIPLLYWWKEGKSTVEVHSEGFFITNADSTVSVEVHVPWEKHTFHVVASIDSNPDASLESTQLMNKLLKNIGVKSYRLKQGFLRRELFVQL